MKKKNSNNSSFAFIAVLLIILSYIGQCENVTKNQRIVRIKNRKFYDDQDRQIILHGTNVVVKVPPYMPQITDHYDKDWSFSLQDVLLLKSRGFNSMRLNVAWSGVQPKKDFYNQTYLRQMQKLINMAGEHQFYTLIQFHQDIFSQKFCGNGVPIWLVDYVDGYKSFPEPNGKHIPLNSSGLPDWSNCTYSATFKYLLSYDVDRMYKNLYNPNHYMNKKFVQYWQKVALTFKNNPYVIGYQMMNQPFVGGFWTNPLLILPTVAQRLKLQDFYDRLSLKIRQVDPDTPICFQPLNWDNIFPMGFTHPPGGFKYRNLSILCPHLYIPPCINQSCIDYRVRDAKRMGIATIMTQLAEAENIVFDKTQYHHLSWMYWLYKDYGKAFMNPYGPANDTSLSYLNVNFTLPYFQRIAGELITSYYNRTTKHFTGIYNAYPNGVTVLYLSNQINYPNGYAMSIVPQKSITVKKSDETGNYLHLKYIGTQKNKKIMVTIQKLNPE